jgi:hypothetical protein
VKANLASVALSNLFVCYRIFYLSINPEIRAKKKKSNRSTITARPFLDLLLGTINLQL